VKVLLAIVLVIALPVGAFMVLYSIDGGCFLCFEGKLEGSQTEKWINLVFGAALLTFILALVGAWIWDRARPK
jgi:hypothetical protein